ncbi:hypothetical protein Tco_0942620 [Tanacetum coccineum]
MSLLGVMAISVISVSSDSLEESVGTSTGRVILFSTIPATIPDTTLFVTPPTTHIDTTPIPTISPTIPPSLTYIPMLHLYFSILVYHASDHISFQHHHNGEVGLGVDIEDESSEQSRSRGTDIEMDVDVERSDEPHSEPEIQAEIDECIAYADALRANKEPTTGGSVRVTRGIKNRSWRIGQQVLICWRDSRAGASIECAEGVEADSVRRLFRNLGPLMGDKGEQEEVIGNGGNGNGGNGNGNGNRGEYGYNFRGFLPAKECTYQDFLKCQPLNFNRTEGVVRLTRWFKKMETVFHISNCPEKYQVKYATCTLLNSALTWWNSHKRTIGIEAASAMSWVELIKLMTEVYGPRIEVQKIETVKSQINRSS